MDENSETHGETERSAAALRIGAGLAGFVVLAGLVFLGLRVVSLEQSLDEAHAKVESQQAELSQLNNNDDKFREELAETAEVTGTNVATEIEAVSSQLKQANKRMAGLETCFTEAMIALQIASVEGFVNDFRSGEVSGYLDLGRFSSDCDPYLDEQPVGD